MTTLLRIAGTSGSGKTTLVKDMMKRRNARAVWWPDKDGKPGKIRGYRFEIPGHREGLVIGRYDLKTGGVDSAFNKKINGKNSMVLLQEEIEAWLNAKLVSPPSLILFEGLIASSIWGRWAKLAETLPFIFAFMDTPVDTCYDNVMIRNGGKPIRRHHLDDLYQRTQRQIKKARAANLDLRFLRWGTGSEDLEAILNSI